MQNKELLFNKNARASMLKGMEILATAVSSTLGPKGQCVVIDEYRDEKPLITKDGVSVAKNIQLRNKFENLGVQLLREASVRTVETAGDATTTTVVLAYEMIKTAEVIKFFDRLAPGWDENLVRDEEKINKLRAAKTFIAARDINSKGENYFALFNDPAYGRCMLVFTPNEQILEGMKPRLNKELMLRLFYNKKV